MKIDKFNEYTEQIDFPIKKFLYIIKSIIEGKIKEDRKPF